MDSPAEQMQRNRNYSDHLLNNGFAVEPSYTLEREIKAIRDRIGSAEYRRQMDDWNAADAAHSDAWDRYTRHKDHDQYKRNCAEINGRPGL